MAEQQRGSESTSRLQRGSVRAAYTPLCTELQAHRKDWQASMVRAGKYCSSEAHRTLLRHCLLLHNLSNLGLLHRQ